MPAIIKLILTSYALTFMYLYGSPRSPMPYFHVNDENSRYCLEVIPTPTLGAKIRCVTMLWDVSVVRKKIWEIEVGKFPYAGEIFFSHDGQSMAIINHPDGLTPLSDLNKWVYIGFYSEGVLKSNVFLRDIVDVKNLSIPAPITSRYEILFNDSDKHVNIIYIDSKKFENLNLPSNTLTESDAVINFITLEKRNFFFSMKNGELLGKLIMER